MGHTPICSNCGKTGWLLMEHDTASKRTWLQCHSCGNEQAVAQSTKAPAGGKEERGMIKKVLKALWMFWRPLWHHEMPPPAKVEDGPDRMRPDVLGVTLGWDCRPTRVFRCSDGFVGIIPGDRRMHPECYDETGWPIDSQGKRLPIHEPDLGSKVRVSAPQTKTA